MAAAEDFRRALFETMQAALHEGQQYLDITAGELHRRVGDYPGPDHRMPVCCHVMKAQLSEEWGDRLIEQPPSGLGRTLRIQYRIPRGHNA